MTCKCILLGIKPYFIHVELPDGIQSKKHRSPYAGILIRHRHQQLEQLLALISAVWGYSYIKYYYKVAYIIQADCIQSKKHRLPYACTSTGRCKQLLDLNLISSDVQFNCMIFTELFSFSLDLLNEICTVWMANSGQICPTCIS